MKDEVQRTKDEVAESVADVVAWIRERAKYVYNDPLLGDIADRIEAAHKRETDGLKTACREIAKECNSINAAKIRESLRNMVRNLVRHDEQDEAALREAEAALKAPPRNCDRFTNPYDAAAEFGRICRPKTASLVYPGPSREQFIGWLFDTAGEDDK